MILSGNAQWLALRCRELRLPCRILPAVSSLDALLCTIAPKEGEWTGFQVVYASKIKENSRLCDPASPAILLGINELCRDISASALARTAARIMALYPARHPLRLVEYGSEGVSEDSFRETSVGRLGRELSAIRNRPAATGWSYMGSLYLPGLR